MVLAMSNISSVDSISMTFKPNDLFRVYYIVASHFYVLAKYVEKQLSNHLLQPEIGARDMQFSQYFLLQINVDLTF